MKRISYAILILLVLQSCAQENESQPNIIVIFADDAGYADFSLNGNKQIQTPNIDAIATNGVKFMNAYVSGPVCSPSRAGLLTGRYQQRFGHEYNIGGNFTNTDPDSIGLAVGEKTIADYLKNDGYRTALIGKWHLGEKPQFHPNQRGFDEFFGMLKGSSAYTSGKAKNIERNGVPVEAMSLPYLTDAFGDEAVNFIESKGEKPFFLFLSFNAPHTPMHARDDYLAEARGQFETESRAINAAMTRSLDENVGKVMQALREQGLEENTLVIFTNDNGGAMPYNASDNSPFSGTKGTFLEGGIHIPFVAQWPGKIEKGSSYNAPIITLDILPTVLSAAGGQVPNNLDGVDFMPYLGQSSNVPHEELFWRLGHHGAVRKGDWKLIWFDDMPPRLHNLSSDIAEQIDLSREEPELTQAMLESYHQWESELIRPVWRTDTIWKAHSRKRYDQSFVNSLSRN
ncbi:sulfatase [Roseivirga sp. E12]|uniref:sulfatase n=1 Tax=Roseivirga sp. E12 TaxID=2819237 RepID=UPI001ABC04BC|nr:sulfatase [Roseivirga sp. E12]MBO3699906.1 sulfatase [Roseivirga sp. E12]